MPRASVMAHPDQAQLLGFLISFLQTTLIISQIPRAMFHQSFLHFR
jgi:hypothetical protein